MGIAEIESRIIEEARAEAEKIISHAELEAREVKFHHQKVASSRREVVLKEAEIKAQEFSRAILTPAKLAARRMILEEKHRLLEEVFKGASLEVKELKLVEVADLLYG